MASGRFTAVGMVNGFPAAEYEILDDRGIVVARDHIWARTGELQTRAEVVEAMRRVLSMRVAQEAQGEGVRLADPLKDTRRPTIRGQNLTLGILGGPVTMDRAQAEATHVFTRSPNLNQAPNRTDREER